MDIDCHSKVYHPPKVTSDLSKSVWFAFRRQAKEIIWCGNGVPAVWRDQTENLSLVR